MDSYIYHHGVKGQKWGIRRYQNKDGSLTPAGKKRKKAKIIAGVAATIALSYVGYRLARSKKLRNIVYKSMQKVSNKPISSNFGKYTIYSNKLGRNLTLEEMAERGLI